MKTPLFKNQMKQFLTASTLFLGVLAVSQVSYAGDRGGNGGSGGEVTQVMVKETITETVQKIARFFENNPKARSEFPEVDFSLLKTVTEEVQIFTSTEVLVDKDGVTRSCLNFPQSLEIICNTGKFNELNKDVPSQYVLVFHELLGLMGVEESSPERELLESYKISQRLKKFVTKVSAYDLVYSDQIRSDYSVEILSDNRLMAHTCDVKQFSTNSISVEGAKKLIEGLEQKGYVFLQPKTRYYSDSSLDTGLKFHFGITEHWTQTSGHAGKLSAYSREIKMGMGVSLPNNVETQTIIVSDQSFRPKLLGKYDEDRTIKWALKKIPSCNR